MPDTSTASIQKWGGIASFVLAASFIIAPLIYLTGNLREAFGALSYSVADFIYGPLWAASLLTGFLALRERLGERAPRRMSVVLLAAALAAALMIAVACIRAANRQYHLNHPELHLESNQAVLIVWTTLVAGVTAAGWHLLGWALVLIASTGWSAGRIPLGLFILYLTSGTAALFVYQFPELEGVANTFGVMWAVWQGIFLLRPWRDQAQPAAQPASQPE